MLAPGDATLLGMARPSTGACALESELRASGRSDGSPPHPARGMRLAWSSFNGAEYAAGNSAYCHYVGPYRCADGTMLEPGDMLCTPCYRAEFVHHHGYDPIAGPTVPRWQRRVR